MESNSMPGGIYSNVQPGMLGLEMSLHHHHHPLPPPNPQNPHLMPPQHHHPMVSYGHHDATDYHPQTHQQSATQNLYPSASKSKNQTLTLSDDDEPGFAAAEDSADDGKRKMTSSPWQRMKWTDNMVKLLIMVVFYIGDEVVVGGGASATEGNDKKKGGGGGGALQKKGKWKSVSRAMMERGFYVSPQQCEDKFNDLNKRYKRVNDILGKGTSCRVVENQSLLVTMDHLSPKVKEEVKKLLNSKHLFFREMCAYHNSCGHLSGAGGGGSGIFQHSPLEATAAEPCLHPNAPVNIMPNLNRGRDISNEGSKLDDDGGGDDDDDSNDDDDDSNDDDVDDDDEDEVNGGGGSRDDISKKRLRKGELINSGLVQELDVELMNVLQDATKGPLEKRQWMKTRLMRLEEEHVSIQSQSFELEKQRVKWLKFSSKKEREMEKEKLTNERLKLENERMVLLIRQKELDLLQLQRHHSHKKTDPSSVTG